ncbi:hypothetical protein HK096_006558 [Nowakowskiella sp. JEL0078]|nr:hypothetical protein HK096_006558 [Nowakowskiella sp. JEL0078]
MLDIFAEVLSQESFAPYGDVIQASSKSSAANQNTARRSNYLTELVNLRSSYSTPSLSPTLVNPPAKENVCVFRVTPTQHNPFPLRLLERHKFSTQMFIPMFPSNSKANTKYVVIVALNDLKTNKPDIGTLRAFLADSTMGFNYRPGVWHHPMVVVSSEPENNVDFMCLVWERGESQTEEDEDTEEIWFVGDDTAWKLDIQIKGLLESIL